MPAAAALTAISTGLPVFVAASEAVVADVTADRLGTETPLLLCVTEDAPPPPKLLTERLEPVTMWPVSAVA